MLEELLLILGDATEFLPSRRLVERSTMQDSPSSFFLTIAPIVGAMYLGMDLGVDD